MAAKSRIRWVRILVCYLLLATLLLAAASLFKPLDVFIYNKVAPYKGIVQAGDSVPLLEPDEKQPTLPDSVVVHTHFECPTVAMIDLQPEQLFPAGNWILQNFFPLLNKISKAGVKNLAVSMPCIWEDGGCGEGHQMMLSQTVVNNTLFEHVVLGMHGRTKAMPDVTPGVLTSCAIPASHVKGAVTNLPFANCKVENDLDGAEVARELVWAPDWLHDEVMTQAPAALSDRSFPLLMRWNGEILPTLPLRLAMSVRGCSANDIYVELGKEIRMGNVTFPIDRHGRLIMSGVSVQKLDINDVWDEKVKIDEKSAPHAVAVLMQPLSEDVAEGRIGSIAATLSQLCAKEYHEYSTVAGAPIPSLWYQPIIENSALRIISVLLLLFIVVRFLPSMPGLLKLVVMFVWLNWLFYQMWSGMEAQQWHHIGVMVVVWLLLLIALPIIKPKKKRSIFSTRR